MMANTASRPDSAPVIVEASHSSHRALVREQQIIDMTPFVIPENADTCMENRNSHSREKYQTHREAEAFERRFSL